MRSATIMLACAVVALLGWAGTVYAQKPGAPSPGSPFTPNSPSCGPVAGCETALLKQWEFYRDVPFHLGEHVRQGKEWDKDYARKESEKLIKQLSLPCELVDAERAGGGKIQVEGRTLDVKVYEAACRSGTGYFLVSQPPQKSLAVSCFAAEAARAADAIQGVKPDEFTCALSSSKDVKTMAASVLKGVGTVCDVRDYRWVGVSYVNGTEYSEVTCADGQGYVIEVPKTGPAAHISVVGCQEAVKQGVKCTLTAVTMPVTLQTFRDALRDQAVDCDPAQIRYIGRETQGRRYVVELQCPQQPKGLVAFIPLGGNPKPFETLDCAAAIARAVQCTLTAKQ
jgi:hypothetical protein